MDERSRTASAQTIAAALPGSVMEHPVADGELTVTAQRAPTSCKVTTLPARRRALPVLELHRRHRGRLARRASGASTSSIICSRPSRTGASGSRSRSTRTSRCLHHRRLSGRRLVRARDLRPLRRPVHRPSGHAAPAHRLRLRGPSAAQGLSAHRLRRGALRRRAEARGLRAGAAHPGIPQLRFSLALGRAGLRRPAGRREGEGPGP